MHITSTENPQAPHNIPLNHKFTALAFEDCLHVSLSAPAVTIAERLHVSSAAPFTLPSHWREWLGTLQSGHFANANLVLLLTRASLTPEVLDQETQDLENELSAFVYGLMLLGVPDYSRSIWFSGANVAGELSVRGQRALSTFYRMPGQERPRLSDDILAEAAALGDEIRKLFALQGHRRVRVGFNKLIDGLRTPDPRRRLHEFVRAIDGLMGLEVGKSTKQFVHRGATFASFSDKRLNCRMFYDLRSAEEHMNDWTPILDPHGTGQRIDRIALELAWADAGQRLATAVYRRLLGRPALLDAFADDSTTKSFWKQDDAARQKQWGVPQLLTVDAAPFRQALS